MHTDLSVGGPPERADQNVSCGRSFVLWPHRSLSRTGMWLVLGAAAAGYMFALVRAPTAVILPLALPAAVALGVLAFAFLANTRAARFREAIEVGPERVVFERRGPSVRPICAEFNSAWVRVRLSSDRYVANRLTLEESGRSLSVGDFLTPEEREDLAQALRQSLAEVRRSAAPRA